MNYRWSHSMSSQGFSSTSTFDWISGYMSSVRQAGSTLLLHIVYTAGFSSQRCVFSCLRWAHLFSFPCPSYIVSFSFHPLSLSFLFLCVHSWESEDEVEELAFSLYLVGSGIELRSSGLTPTYLLRCLTGLFIELLK